MIYQMNVWSAHFWAPAFKNTTRIQREDPQRERALSPSYCEPTSLSAKHAPGNEEIPLSTNGAIGHLCMNSEPNIAHWRAEEAPILDGLSWARIGTNVKQLTSSLR